MSNRLTAGGKFQALLQIHREILQGNYPNATDLSAKIGITAKTARRYVKALEGYGLRPIYEDVRHGYYYDRPASLQLTPRLREDEVVAYFLLEETTRSLAGSPVSAVLESVMRKMSMMLPAGTNLTFDDLSSAISLRNERASVLPVSAAKLNAIYRGITQTRSLKIAYEGRQRQEPTTRVIDPLHLTRCEGQWYLIAYCHLRKGMRTFVPVRMKDVKLLDKKFKRPDDFDAREHFKNAFGVVADVNVSPVSVVFEKSAAPLVRERVWHATQQLEELDGGKVRLKLVCSQGTELLAWLLGWGDQVRVESPAGLRKKLVAAHKDAMSAQK